MYLPFAQKNTSSPPAALCNDSDAHVSTAARESAASCWKIQGPPGVLGSIEILPPPKIWNLKIIPNLIARKLNLEGSGTISFCEDQPCDFFPQKQASVVSKNPSDL